MSGNLERPRCFHLEGDLDRSKGPQGYHLAALYGWDNFMAGSGVQFHFELNYNKE